MGGDILDALIHQEGEYIHLSRKQGIRCPNAAVNCQQLSMVFLTVILPGTHISVVWCFPMSYEERIITIKIRRRINMPTMLMYRTRLCTHFLARPLMPVTLPALSIWIWLQCGAICPKHLSSAGYQSQLSQWGASPTFMYISADLCCLTQKMYKWADFCRPYYPSLKLEHS